MRFVYAFSLGLLGVAVGFAVGVGVPVALGEVLDWLEGDRRGVMPISMLMMPVMCVTGLVGPAVGAFFGIRWGLSTASAPGSTETATAETAAL